MKTKQDITMNFRGGDITMEFKKYTRFDADYWFCGIYKIAEYTWFKGGPCEPYYHVYKIIGKQWGDYVGGKPAQYDKKLTFDECIELCKEHAKEYQPTTRELNQADKSRDSWIGMDDKNKAA